MRIGLSLAITMAVATPALAAQDKPILAPPAAWVKPAPFPTDTATKGDAPVRLLLADQQVHFADGATTRYQEAIFRIQTPQGLQAGSISFPWDPDIDTLTVHKLQIHRGAKVIDVLASQSFTVMRREQNLENAVLDGILTANIQPEGLQVGDIIDFSASITRRDPAMKGHYEAMSGGWGALPLGEARLSVDWPKTADVRWRERGQLPPLKTASAKGATTAALTIDDVQPVIAPQGAPPRYDETRVVEFSDFKDWAALSALMAPLYDKAATLPADAKLDAEIARIAAASTEPKARAAAALKLVQDRVRYVFLGMNDGGLVPADAETTWERRFGDCKGKTALLLALLHGLGIAAEPVLVNSRGGDGLDQYLPMVELFDHVLVRATIGGRAYWLDGTRTGDGDIDTIKTPAFRWVLPVQPENATLVHLVQPPLDEPDTETTLRLDASAGVSLPAPAHAEIVFRGDAGTALSLQLAPLTGDALQDALRKYWRGQYNFIDVQSAGASYDPATHEEKIVMDGTAKMDWSSSQYETDGTGVGYKADFTRTPGPDQDAPFAVDYPSYSKTIETIVLPNGGKGFTFANGDKIDQTVAGVAYHRTATIAKGVATIVTTARAMAPEFAAKDAPAAQAALRALDKQTVYVDEPSSYQPTEQEVAAALAKTPTTADGFVERGLMLMHRGDNAKAVADFDQAAKLDPKSAWAPADRALAHLSLHQFDAAQKDVDQAAALDPDNYVVSQARGTLALEKGKFADATAAFDKALASQPNDAFSLGQRAVANQMLGNNDKAIADADRLIALGKDSAFVRNIRAKAEHAAGDNDKALADADRAIAFDPHIADTYLLRANIYHAKGDKERALAQAAAMVAANPDSDYAHTAAGAIYSTFGQTDKAMAEFNKAIAIKPTASAYLTRMHWRPKADIAGRKADVAAALKLDPDMAEAIEAEAELDQESGDYPKAIAAITRALATTPANAWLLAERGIAHARAGDEALAAKDYAAARDAAANPALLNNICWSKATAGVSLSDALADCDAALGKAPNDPTMQDSRAFVLLRLGRYPESIAEYDKALATRPNQASSLYGRAVAEARAGRATDADRDLAAAKKADAGVVDEFTGYGVTMTPPTPDKLASTPTGTGPKH